MISKAQLSSLFPALPAAGLEGVYGPLIAGMERYEITTPKRQSAYLATLGEESKELTDFEENLNYSAKRLMAVWPKRFPTLAKATLYAHNPEKLANYVYANRLGNGGPETGDGWKNRGRGPIQATGGDMYRKVSPIVGVDLIANPDALLEPEHGFVSSAWIFVVEKGCLPPADRGDIRAVTIRVNGGVTNLEHRSVLYGRALHLLAA